ncbi:hypothetical protein HDK77DRAFT_28520 [Phyllosticta capitalensis]
MIFFSCLLCSLQQLLPECPPMKPDLSRVRSRTSPHNYSHMSFPDCTFGWHYKRSRWIQQAAWTSLGAEYSKASWKTMQSV